MTTADLRWVPAAAPSATIDRPVADSDAVEDVDSYVGRHRKPGGRSLSVLRMLYRPRHRAV